ncbi:MAG: hypothetical protein COT81_05015 [Candidatus Buchananbacteria bacterium CG10_big_fil_rev_8_21_14_0_10_42_9]|uniref:Hemolysin n=1 Tax=Candidatus Buchananbacteria bacterium CG10_big_fil_rev_8_21_14_0_10_42_9 TaxID=1974526 RepID=A0A2H0W025_9BACT|nr:MAG: hypothetical protein COT81_05015 [Candidatus Buchananbacteria bacterium CG10_big_fil_rev_8_21_14_0_10_42_9]
MSFVLIIFLVALSGIFSGLTLGFFSLNKDDLKRKAELGDKQAQKVYAIRENGNLLLCTLLIGNVAVNSTLSIFLGSLTSGFAAGLIATALIVIFGEIVPQASFSRHALVLGAKLSGLVKLFIIILLPICWPIAWTLNKMLGEEIPTVYSRKEIIKLVEHQEDLFQSEIDADEEKIVKGALSFSNRKVKDVMTPKEKMYCISSTQKLTQDIVKKIYATGHSRIPIYDKSPNKIIGMLYVKDLVGQAVGRKNAGQIARQNAFLVNEDRSLDDVLNAFKAKRNHLFIVTNSKPEVTGIITIEDILEEIIGGEIVDEFDELKIHKA